MQVLLNDKKEKNVNSSIYCERAENSSVRSIFSPILLRQNIGEVLVLDLLSGEDA